MTEKHNKTNTVIPKNKNKPENAPIDLVLPLSKEDKFAHNLFVFPTVKEAAVAAGYSPSSCRSTIYTKMRSEKFLNKVRQSAKNHDVMQLPKMQKVEDQLVDYLTKNPLEVSKHARIWSQKKRIAGILQEEAPPVAPRTVNIDLNLFWQQALPDVEPIEAEVEDTQGIEAAQIVKDNEDEPTQIDGEVINDKDD